MIWSIDSPFDSFQNFSVPFTGPPEFPGIRVALLFLRRPLRLFPVVIPERRQFQFLQVLKFPARRQVVHRCAESVAAVLSGHSPELPKAFCNPSDNASNDSDARTVTGSQFE